MEPCTGAIRATVTDSHSDRQGPIVTYSDFLPIQNHLGLYGGDGLKKLSDGPHFFFSLSLFSLPVELNY